MKGPVSRDRGRRRPNDDHTSATYGGVKTRAVSEAFPPLPLSFKSGPRKTGRNSMQSILIVIQLFVSIAMICVVLLQRSEGGALGMGGGGSGLGGLFSPRGAADTLTRTTAILAVLFFLTSLGLTVLSLHGRPQSLLEANPGAPVQTLPIGKSPPKPAAPAVPSPHG
jgi:preprotein translocase subunit SecG